MNKGARCFKLTACCCIPFQPPLSFINLPKAPVSSEGYHVVIIANSPLSRMSRLLEGEAYQLGDLERVIYGPSFCDLSKDERPLFPQRGLCLVSMSSWHTA